MGIGQTPFQPPSPRQKWTVDVTIKSFAVIFGRRSKSNGRCKLQPQLMDYLIEISDRCIRIARHGQRLVEEFNAAIGPKAKEPYSRLSNSARELVDELEALGRELLSKAVEIDTERDKNSPGTFGL